MKIVHIITSLGVGGAERLLVNVANNLVLKNEVTVIYFKESDLVEDFDKRIKVIQVDLNFKALKQTKKILKDIQPDIVHTHLTHADLIGLLAARSLKNVKTFCTIHNTKYKHNFLDNIYYLIYIILFNVLSRKTQVFAISKKLIQIINKTLLVSKKRILLLYNIVSENPSKKTKEEILESLNVSPEAFKILFVGRLTKQKAVHTLIKAINDLDTKVKENIVVFIVGGGELLTSLQALTSELGLDNNIRFEGISNHVEDYYKIADTFVLPSIFEGLPLVLLEALNAGVPIISSNIEGPVELINNEKNGFLFECGNHIELAQKITQLYHDETLRNIFASEGQEVFTKNFKTSSYITKLEKTYLNQVD